MPLSAAQLETIDRMECELLEIEYHVRRLNLWLAVRFSPDQPRVPAGQPGGGQWTREGSGDGAQIVPAQELLIGRLPPWIGDLLDRGILPREILDQPREPVPGLSGKEAADNVPSWVEGEKPTIGESGNDFAKRVMDDQYGKGNWNRRDNPEYQK